MKRFFIISILILPALFIRGQAGDHADVTQMLLDFVKRYARELSDLKMPQLVQQRLNDD